MSFDERYGPGAGQELSRPEVPAGSAEADSAGKIIDAARLQGVRRGFTTRRVQLPDQLTLLRQSVCPQPGELALALSLIHISEPTRR